MVYNDKCLFDSDDDQEPPTKVPKGAVLQSNSNQWHSNFAESRQAQGVVTTPYCNSQKASAGTSQSDAIRFLPNQLETPATMMVGQGRNTPSNGISAQSNFSTQGVITTPYHNSHIASGATSQSYEIGFLPNQLENQSRLTPFNSNSAQTNVKSELCQDQGILASLYQDSQLASLGTTQMDDKGFQPVQNKNQGSVNVFWNRISPFDCEFAQNNFPKDPSTNRLSENLGNFSFEVLLDKLKEQLETPTNQEEFIMEVASES
ncbi:hypothetical protein PPACK8108_LOCUS23422 [Phakopsora pachyrhizi]|uniref:Uncharacterized protein n=1 Tax=Phakopsora pachyrhizi TaxID=170000 RepID=A0AAV0BMB6_PHAPC|nr:hypothetical protein PPACK8108_LOCUS23422 [Phakopsora pachyrhizi]